MKDYGHLLKLFLDHLQKYKSGLSNKQPKELYDPEHYILSLGGKRLRPLLSLIACELLDKDPVASLDSALCVELFHNFSLMHDDILDSAPLRRNQPTVHTKWNTNIAILSGDVMLVKAYQVLQNYKADEYKQLSELFTRTAIEVCEGQQQDMNFENTHTVTVSDYLNMITNKTAVLLGCSLQMGAINAGADIKTQKELYSFGKHLGIAFQLLDDVLDAYPIDKEKFGKQIGGDIMANKKTYLLLKAMELSKPEQKNILDSVMTSKEISGEEKVNKVLSVFDQLNIKNLSIQKADEHTQLAIGYLDLLSANENKKVKLKDFALSLLNRQS